MSEKRIDEAKVRHVARLARVAVTEEEVRALAGELDQILGHFAELDALDVGDVPPTFHAVPLEAPLREDAVTTGLPREEALAQAPEAEDDGFAVPRVVEGA